MSRIKLIMPPRTMASFSIPVRIGDINYGNHVGNDAFVSLVHEARMQWLQQYDYTELSLEGIGLIMSDLCFEFKQEAFYPEILTIAVAAGEISRVAFELFYEISSHREEKIVLALARTGMVCYDYPNKKVAPVPGKLQSILEG